MKKKVTILFGEMGAGKSFLGKRLAENRNVPFIEGDALMPVEMMKRVASFMPLSTEMLTDFSVALRRGVIDIATQSERGVVVSQALYKNLDRRLLAVALESRGFEVEYVYVTAPFMRNVKQLWARDNGFKWILYWICNGFFFEDPDHGYVPVSTTAHIDFLAAMSP